MVLCRRNEHEHGIGLAVFLFGQDSSHRFGAGRRMPDELKITVSRYRIFPKRDLIPAVLILNADDRVEGRFDRGDGKPGVQGQGQAERVARALSGRLHRRCDARGVGHPIGVEPGS